MASEKRKTLISTGNVARNKKIGMNYHMEEKVEAGIVLTGPEVKSLREGRVSINEAYASFKEGELFLVNASILEYGAKGYAQHIAGRPRKLLLKKREMKKLMGAVLRKGYTLVPVSLYFNPRGIAKVELALAVGKTNIDRREDIKKRDWNREKHRVLKVKNR